MQHILCRVIRYMIWAVALIFISACSPSKEEITAQAIESMQHKLDVDTSLSEFKLKVDSLTIVRESENKYKGVANVKYNGENNSVSVEIIADGEDLIWHASPMAFAFVLLKPDSRRRDEVEKENTSKYMNVQWAVQLASLKDIDAAVTLKNELKKQGHDAYIRKIDGVYRVYIGPFVDRAESERVRDSLSRGANRHGFVVRYASDLNRADLL